MCYVLILLNLLPFSCSLSLESSSLLSSSESCVETGLLGWLRHWNVKCPNIPHFLQPPLDSVPMNKKIQYCMIAIRWCILLIIVNFIDIYAILFEKVIHSEY